MVANGPIEDAAESGLGVEEARNEGKSIFLRWSKTYITKTYIRKDI
jgi:hypothetical protein